ncbi:Persistence and stress-resistance toxin PasT [bacterium HR39]|nr:Persistence and stress-resistance toxin PasT [bacterium HR39]
MPTHAEKRHLPWTCEQLFRLVAEVDRYPEFLPWCRAARVVRRDGNVFWADLVVAFKMFRERFRSKVTLTPPHRIDVEYIDGPFRYLNNHWVFEEAPDGGCIVDFFVDFEFKSKFLQSLMEMLFNEAVRRMVAAFERRAVELYGPDGRPAAKRAQDIAGKEEVPAPAGT